MPGELESLALCIVGKQVRRLVDERPQDERFAHLLAFLDLSENRFEEALSSYDQFIGRNPDAIESRINQALVLLKLQRTPQAFDRIRQAFAVKGIGFEVMDTSAACRTYNVLVSEGRDVMALLIID